MMPARRAHAPNLERAMFREAVHVARVTETIGRRLGDELISASRAVLSAYGDIAITASDRRARRRFERAIDRLEELVGKP